MLREDLARRRMERLKSIWRRATAEKHATRQSFYFKLNRRRDEGDGWRESLPY
jgi:hypothetical protein